MAKIGTTPAANRYDGLATGAGFIYSFETQEGIPVDASSAFLRELSPFTIRIVPPDALFSISEAAKQSVTGLSGLGLGAAQTQAFASAEQASVNLISDAAKANDFTGFTSSIANSLARVTLIDVSTARLQSAVADGQFLSEKGDEFLSTIVDAGTAADIALQLQHILTAPPLTLLINPTSMNISYTKSQSYGSRVRTGHIFEAWGEEQPKISFSGTTGGFVAGVGASAGTFPVENGQANSVSGLQYGSKRDSAAWQNFMSLYTFYRNNGYIYDTLGASDAHLFVGALAIDYDQWTYIGHIESFSYGYEEEQPHRVTFDLDFTVSRMFDWAQAGSVVLPMNSPMAGNIGQVGSAGTTALSITTGSDEDVAQTPLDLMG